MKLIEALDIETERIIALVGSGGKTSALFMLGRELAEKGLKVVLTTTTRMFLPQPGQIPIVLADEQQRLCQGVAAILTENNQVLVAPGVEDNKLTPLPCRDLLSLAALPQVDVVVVEADGSRGLPLKFPADYEPVVCSADTVVVPVLGISALGAAVDEQHCQRWELAAKYLDIEYGTRITPKLAAAIITHPCSYGRFLGTNRVIPLLNQVETRAQEDGAWETARVLLAQGGIDRVVIAAIQTAQPVRAVIHRDGGKKNEV